MPFKGNAPATTAVLAGQVEILFGALPPLLPHVSSGRCARSRSAPPSARRRCQTCLPSPRAGFPDFDIALWLGFFAPKGTPPAIIKRLETELMQIAQSPNSRTRSRSRAWSLCHGAAELGKLLNTEITTIRRCSRRRTSKWNEGQEDGDVQRERHRSRLPNLLEWLEREAPDIACLQELKAADTPSRRAPPRRRLRGHLARAEAAVERRRHPGKGKTDRARRGLPGTGGHAKPLSRGGGAGHARRVPVPAQRQSPARPEVRVQARVVRAPHRHAKALYAAGTRWCWPATTTSCRRRSTSTTRSRGARMRCCSRRRASATAGCSPRVGRPIRTQASRTSASTRSGITSVSTGSATPGCASITCCSTDARAAARVGGRGSLGRGLEKASDHAPAWVTLV